MKNSRDALGLNLTDTMRFAKKSLFILGGQSEYIRQEDTLLIQKYFPSVTIKTILEAGHYLHYTHSKEFLQIVSEFIRAL